MQSKVTRGELRKMSIGETSIFSLDNPKKMQSAATTCNQLKNEREGEWTIRRDFKSNSISITRIK